MVKQDIKERGGKEGGKGEEMEKDKEEEEEPNVFYLK